ncbi:MAG: hypothetical protein ACI97K_003024 [Glaciecola sp.]|jgi:hypothetical protein
MNKVGKSAAPFIGDNVHADVYEVNDKGSSQLAFKDYVNRQR